MQNSMMVFTFPFSTGNTLFGVNLVPKFKIVCLKWNLVSRLIRICGIQWSYSLFSTSRFCQKNPIWHFDVTRSNSQQFTHRDLKPWAFSWIKSRNFKTNSYLSERQERTKINHSYSVCKKYSLEYYEEIKTWPNILVVFRTQSNIYNGAFLQIDIRVCSKYISGCNSWYYSMLLPCVVKIVYFNDESIIYNVPEICQDLISPLQEWTT